MMIVTPANDRARRLSRVFDPNNLVNSAALGRSEVTSGSQARPEVVSVVRRRNRHLEEVVDLRLMFKGAEMDATPLPKSDLSELHPRVFTMFRCHKCGNEYDARVSANCPECYTEDGRQIEPSHWVQTPDGPRQVGGIGAGEMRRRVMSGKPKVVTCFDADAEIAAMRRARTLDRMEREGGSFVQALANAARRADESNYAKLSAAFSEYWEKYGTEI